MGASGTPFRRVALVHDFLVDVRGAERVFSAICDVWPQADLFTAVYDEEGTEGRFAHRDVHTSFLQRLRPTARTFRALLPLYPAAVESLDLREFDLVVSTSTWRTRERRRRGSARTSGAIRAWSTRPWIRLDSGRGRPGTTTSCCR